LAGELTRYNYRITPYRKPFLIYNPAAGKIRRNPERILQRTIAALRRASVEEVLLLPTGKAGHGAELARHAMERGADLILVLGGDGTINEVANGMIGSEVALGILPGGTANVLCMELGLGRDLDRAIERLSKALPRRIAVGRMIAAGAPDRHFLLMCGAGLDARIVNDVNPDLKRRAGKLAYWTAGFSQFTRLVAPLEVRINGETHRCGFLLASRVRNYGGDMEIASGASLLKPDFEVVWFEGSNPLRYAWYMLGVASRRVLKMRGVRSARATRVEFAGSAHTHIDGEYIGVAPVSFEIVPDALTLLIPELYG